MRLVTTTLLFILSSFGHAFGQATELDQTSWRTAKETGLLTPADCKQSPTAIIRFSFCDAQSKASGLCGSVVAFNPEDNELGLSDAELKAVKDTKNPDPSLQDRQILGVQLFRTIQRENDVLVGEGYSPCRGEVGKICLNWDGQSDTLEQWACKSFASCTGVASAVCTQKYTWTKVEQIPAGWLVD